MEIWQALVLGVVEGITEFLPISSTGHMILVSNLIRISPSEFLKSFEIIIQLGAIAAVFVISFRTLLSKHTLYKPLLIAFLPTATVGFVLYKLIKQYFLGNAWITIASLFIGGIAFILLERFFSHRKPTITLDTISPPKAAGIGLFQCISMIPGVSRSAATIFGGMGMGLSRVDAVEFSFFLAIPTMLAATGYDLLKTGFSFTSTEYSLLGIGLLTSFITAILAIKLFHSYVRNHTFVAFGIYRIVIAILFFFFMR